jgi:hypothetical protein
VQGVAEQFHSLRSAAAAAQLASQASGSQASGGVATSDASLAPVATWRPPAPRPLTNKSDHALSEQPFEGGSSRVTPGGLEAAASAEPEVDFSRFSIAADAGTTSVSSALRTGVAAAEHAEAAEEAGDDEEEVVIAGSGSARSGAEELPEGHSAQKQQQQQHRNHPHAHHATADGAGPGSVPKPHRSGKHRK